MVPFQIFLKASYVIQNKLHRPFPLSCHLRPPTWILHPSLLGSLLFKLHLSCCLLMRQVSGWHPPLLRSLPNANESGRLLLIIFLVYHCRESVMLTLALSPRALCTIWCMFESCLLCLPQLNYQLHESRSFYFSSTQNRISTEWCSIDICWVNEPSK
jgi:hypothetical protein